MISTPADKLLSIVTPVRNGSGYADVCLSSVLAAGFRHAEHIVCDGGSTDGTFELAEKRSNDTGSMLRVFRIVDRSMTEGLNNALTQAKGIWVMPLNIDDQLVPGVGAHIETILANSDSDIVFFDVLIRKDGRDKCIQRPWLCRRSIAWDVLGCFITECGVAMRASAIEDLGGYDNKYSLAADYDLYTRFVKRCKVQYSPLTVGIFNETSLNLSHTMKDVIVQEASAISRLGRFYGWLQSTRIDKALRIVTGIQSYFVGFSTKPRLLRPAGLT